MKINSLFNALPKMPKVTPRNAITAAALFGAGLLAGSLINGSQNNKTDSFVTNTLTIKTQSKSKESSYSVEEKNDKEGKYHRTCYYANNKVKSEYKNWTTSNGWAYVLNEYDENGSIIKKTKFNSGEKAVTETVEYNSVNDVFKTIETHTDLGNGNILKEITKYDKNGHQLSISKDTYNDPYHAAWGG